MLGLTVGVAGSVGSEGSMGWGVRGCMLWVDYRVQRESRGTGEAGTVQGTVHDHGLGPGKGDGGGALRCKHSCLGGTRCEGKNERSRGAKVSGLPHWEDGAVPTEVGREAEEL